ncbi:hypothetical protein BSKO_07027 [Bryopsis sp. KO-2023]|nr:hypothetical protein BSKO_07027 [Bryopsis sp. KO-2023]
MESLRTVFVRSVAPSITDDSIHNTFQTVGPVQHSFLVKGKDQRAHKGFGFVEFVKAADAKLAVQQLDGKKLEGRPIKVEIARPRTAFKDRKKRKIEEVKTEELREKEEPLEGPFADPIGQILTIAIGNVTPALASLVEKKAYELGEVEDVLYPAPMSVVRTYKLESDGCKGNVMLVAYKTVKEVFAAVAHLHDSEIEASWDQIPKRFRKKKRRKLGQAKDSGDKKKGTEEEEGEKGDEDEEGKEKKEEEEEEELQRKATLWCRQLSGEGRHLDKHQVILRNLPFKVTEDGLRELLKPAGFVWKLVIPKKDDGKMKGFAFATFISNSHAKKAVALVNDTKLKGRKIGVEMAMPKNMYDKKKDAAEGKTKPGKDAYRTEVDAEAADQRVEDVLKSFVKAEEGSESEELESISDGSEEEQEEEEDSMSDKESELSSESGELGEEIDEVAGTESVPRTMSEGIQANAGYIPLHPQKTTQQSKPKRAPESNPPGKEQKDATKEKKGSLDDRSTEKKNMAAGRKDARSGVDGDERSEEARLKTVFVRGLPLDCPDHMLHGELERFGPLKHCLLVKSKQTGKPKGTAFAEFVRKGDADRAVDFGEKASKGIGPGIFVLGTQVHVNRAITHEDAQKMAQEKAVRERPDRKNLYLMKEGRIEEGSLVWKGLSPAEKSKRARAMQMMKEKLKDPNCFVSMTRLMVRNLPRSMTSKELGKLFSEAVVERAKDAKPEVKHAIVLTDSEKGKTQCRGFVEFMEHEHALAALRQLNANPFTFSAENRPIVEFAIENAKKLQIRQDKAQRRKVREASRNGTGAHPISEFLNKKKVKEGMVADVVAAEAAKGQKTSNEDVVEEGMSKKALKKMKFKEKWKKIHERTRKSAERRSEKQKEEETDQDAETPVDERPDGITKAGKGRKRKAKPQTAPPRLQREEHENASEKPEKKKSRKGNNDGEGHDRLDDILSKYKSKLLGSDQTYQASFAKWFN